MQRYKYRSYIMKLLNKLQLFPEVLNNLRLFASSAALKIPSFDCTNLQGGTHWESFHWSSLTESAFENQGPLLVAGSISQDPGFLTLG